MARRSQAVSAVVPASAYDQSLHLFSRSFIARAMPAAAFSIRIIEGTPL
jgi:hypothetical protein